MVTAPGQQVPGVKGIDLRATRGACHTMPVEITCEIGGFMDVRRASPNAAAALRRAGENVPSLRAPTARNAAAHAAPAAPHRTGRSSGSGRRKQA
jgi:hypothetical protein